MFTRRGTWDLLDHYNYFFPRSTSYIVSSVLTLILELIRSTFSKFNKFKVIVKTMSESANEGHFLLFQIVVTNRLKILDDDTRLQVLKKNILLSFFDILYNISCITWWRSIWGHPEGEIFIHE